MELPATGSSRARLGMDRGAATGRSEEMPFSPDGTPDGAAGSRAEVTAPLSPPPGPPSHAILNPSTMAACSFIGEEWPWRRASSSAVSSAAFVAACTQREALASSSSAATPPSSELSASTRASAAPAIRGWLMQIGGSGECGGEAIGAGGPPRGVRVRWLCGACRACGVWATLTRLDGTTVRLEIGIDLRRMSVRIGMGQLSKEQLDDRRVVRRLACQVVVRLRRSHRALRQRVERREDVRI